MSEYRRFASYLYQYEQDRKGKNVGFSRIELRDGRRRIQIQVRGAAGLAGSFLVCGFVRSGMLCIGIPFGKMLLQNGNGNFSAEIFEKEAGEKSLEDWSGLVLLPEFSGRRGIATAWDEGGFALSRLVRSREEWEELQAAYLPEQDSEEASEPQSGLSSERKLEEREAPGQEDGTGSGNSRAAVTEGAAENAEPTSTYEGSGKQNGSEPESAGAALPGEQPKEQGSQNGQGFRQNNSGKTFRSQQVLPEPLSWDGFCKLYPKVRPFSPEDTKQCLRIRPGDLGRLPRKDWVLGNNSFLLHGYYQYRYLLLVRETEEPYPEMGAAEAKVLEKNPSFYIGVPGTSGQNERFLAGLFGFGRFCPAGGQEKREPAFGFWLREVELEEENDHR